MEYNRLKKKFLIIGLGPIGKMFACYLKTKGHYICGIDIRRDFVEAIAKNGINIKGLTTLGSKIDEVNTEIGELKEQEFDYVMISVKTPFLGQVVEKVKKLKNNFKIVAMQNGIDNEEFLAEHFAKERVIRMVVNFAGNIISPGVVKMTFFHKPNYVGCICDDVSCKCAEELAGMMTEAVLETESTNEIKKFAWRKTILVASLAPISAILGMTMAEVMAWKETSQLVENLLGEAIDVARAADFDYGEEFFESCLKYLSTAGHHKPSMLIDMEDGFPTEIGYINGKIADYAQKYNISAVLNTSITNMVKAKERLQAEKRYVSG